MSFGGFLGVMGNQYHPLPWSVLKYDTGRGGYVVNLDKQQLDGAPAYNEDAEPEWATEPTRRGSTTTTVWNLTGACNASGLSAFVGASNAERPPGRISKTKKSARENRLRRAMPPLKPALLDAGVLAPLETEDERTRTRLRAYRSAPPPPRPAVSQRGRYTDVR